MKRGAGIGLVQIEDLFRLLEDIAVGPDAEQDRIESLVSGWNYDLMQACILSGSIPPHSTESTPVASMAEIVRGARVAHEEPWVVDLHIDAYEGAVRSSTTIADEDSKAVGEWAGLQSEFDRVFPAALATGTPKPAGPVDRWAAPASGLLF